MSSEEDIEALISRLVKEKQWDALKELFLSRDIERMVKVLAEIGVEN